MTWDLREREERKNVTWDFRERGGERENVTWDFRERERVTSIGMGCKELLHCRDIFNVMRCPVFAVVHRSEDEDEEVGPQPYQPENTVNRME